ncbi:MAG: hypothetical protein IKW21_05205 [Lachnospiraceae bacterium]|nr:hypothetical protein [Lachnospiraceae bacterium]
MSNKLKAKPKKTMHNAPYNIGNMSMQQLAKVTGCRVDSLKFWCAAREKEMEADFQKRFNEKFMRCEDYMCLANVLMSLYAIHKTWGFTKSIPRFLDNLNDAQEYVDKMGVENFYKKVNKEWGVELEFDSVDLNKEFGFGS